MKIFLAAASTALALTVGMAGAPSLAASPWPSKPIRLVVPYPPGGGGDGVVRVIADKLGQRLGQPVVIENRPGASGYIGSQNVANSAPDGYTLLLGFDGTLVVAPHLVKAPFDPIKDLVPITKLTNVALILAANPSVPAKTIKELVVDSKRDSAGMGYGSSGRATTTHLAGELLAQKSTMRIRHIPYKGGGQAVTDVLGGQIPLIFTVIPTAVPFVKEGKLRGIAVTGAHRSELLPDVPTMAESGVAGLDVQSWYGLLAPANTPKAIVDRIAKETAAVLAEPNVVQRYAKLGYEPAANSPEEFSRQIKDEYSRWKNVVNNGNISID